jgi:RNA polymerase-binding protein DksA
MTEEKANAIRKVLQSNVIELGSAGQLRSEILVEQAADPLDRVLCATERDSAVARLEATFANLRAARAALQRLDDGTYGICTACGEEINPQRLAAVPTASMCIICQEADDLPQREERSFLTFRDAA